MEVSFIEREIEGLTAKRGLNSGPSSAELGKLTLRDCSQTAGGFLEQGHPSKRRVGLPESPSAYAC
jgi:hypothetical protein